MCVSVSLYLSLSLSLSLLRLLHFMKCQYVVAKAMLAFWNDDIKCWYCLPGFLFVCTADFGLSRVITESTAKMTICGTPGYVGEQ